MAFKESLNTLEEITEMEKIRELAFDNNCEIITSFFEYIHNDEDEGIERFIESLQTYFWSGAIKKSTNNKINEKKEIDKEKKDDNINLEDTVNNEENLLDTLMKLKNE